MTLARVPVVPSPPHDPTSLLLDSRVGWRTTWTTDVEIVADEAVRLSPVPQSLPAMANDAGTFGNLVLPSHLAVTGDGTVLLLDRASGVLLRFDPCTCAFVAVHCARAWVDPRGIAVCRDSLYVCDPASKRVVALALNGLGIRQVLRPPVAQHPHWEPWGIAFDHRARAYVTDRSAGLVHRFDRQGRWLGALAGFAMATWIALDCRDRLFVRVDGLTGPEVRVTDVEGAEVSVSLRPDLLAPDFPRLPFAVDETGDLHLGPLCAPTDASCTPPPSGWFDASGQPLPVPPAEAPVMFLPTGEMVVGPLDSRIARCVWHRIQMSGDVPPGTKLVVGTFTADQALASDQLAALATWATEQTVQGGPDWDCLVRSGPGRYAWLRLAFSSNGAASAEVRRLVVEFPRLGPRRYLPAVFGAEPVSADFTDRFLALFDTTLRGIERQIDTQAHLFDPSSAPAERLGSARIDFLSWLASWIGVSLDRRWSEAQRRRFLAAAGGLFDCRGTLPGLRAQLGLVLGLDAYDHICPRQPPSRRCGCPPANCAPAPTPEPWRRPPLVLEHFRLRRWLWVGAGRLGEQAVLWGNRIANRTSLDVNARAGGSRLLTATDPLRDPYHVYAHRFSVFVPCRYRGDKARRSLEGLLKSESPAHTQHQLVFVEPRFRIGVQSMIGFDAVVGGVPTGVRLGDTRLQGAAVLTSKLSDGAAPFAVGRQGRVGTTTRVG